MRRRHRPARRPAWAVLAVVAVAASWVVAPPAGGADLHPANRPTPLAGRDNGRVPQDDLVTAGPGCRVARDAAPSLALLLRQARARGVGLGTAGCYRPIDAQVSLHARNTATGGPCTATPRYDPDGRPRGTSNHGWGKAVDFSDVAGELRFRTATFAFLTAHAETVGWVHPDWAGPGLRCAEPWHWEWVGDGGTHRGPVVRADVVALLLGGFGAHSVVDGLGGVATYGGAPFHGSLGGQPLEWVVVDAAATPAGRGYWLTSGDGGVFTFGDAGFFGSTGAVRLSAPVVGMAATPSGQGYWLVASDGGVFTFGDAGFFGSTGAVRLSAPVVGMAATPSGQGYWLVASDGGVFTFGDAGFFGSTGGLALQAPVVSMAATSDGEGYWLLAEDGGLFTFGTAPFLGSAAGTHPSPFVDVATSGTTYWLVAADGHVVPAG